MTTSPLANDIIDNMLNARGSETQKKTARLPPSPPQDSKEFYKISQPELQIVFGWVKNSLALVTLQLDKAIRLSDVGAIKRFRESKERHNEWIHRIEKWSSSINSTPLLPDRKLAIQKTPPKKTTSTKHKKSK